MQINSRNRSLLLGAGFFLVSGLGCSNGLPSGPPPFLGSWRSVISTDTVTLQFLSDKSVTIHVINPQVDYTLSASWRWLDSNHVRITAPAGLPDAFLPKQANVRFTVTSDALTFTGDPAQSVTYHRLSQ